jgi:hypothetical protein
MQLDENLKIVDNSMVHREGIKLATINEIPPTTDIGVNMNNFSEEKILNMLKNMKDNIDPNSIMEKL